MIKNIALFPEKDNQLLCLSRMSYDHETGYCSNNTFVVFCQLEDIAEIVLSSQKIRNAFPVSSR